MGASKRNVASSNQNAHNKDEGGMNNINNNNGRLPLHHHIQTSSSLIQGRGNRNSSFDRKYSQFGKNRKSNISKVFRCGLFCIKIMRNKIFTKRNGFYIFSLYLMATFSWFMLKQFYTKRKWKQWERSKKVAITLGWGNYQNRMHPLPIIVELSDKNLPTHSKSVSYQQITRIPNDVSIRKYTTRIESRVANLDVEVFLNAPSSRDYKKRSREKFITENCIQQYDWQLESYPTCNSLHEVSMGHNEDNVELINHGYWRDVWVFNDVDGSNQVLKTIR